MPVSVIVGGQFGSEGKGKVAYELARKKGAAAVVRVGGTNSGHTAVDPNGTAFALRQLPASAISGEPLVIIPPGSLIDKSILLREVEELDIGPDRLMIDSRATVISESDIETESAGQLQTRIGSTSSGTGAALARRIMRSEDAQSVEAKYHKELQPFLQDTNLVMRGILDRNERIIIEGTQGFGLSLFHGGYYPFCTSRDTTAGAFVSEAGVSPLDVDEIVLVIRCFPIRVAGNSGPLANEITWDELAEEGDLPAGYHEKTTATGRVRRVARFDPEIVRRAIAVNNPSSIALNHLDYIDPNAGANGASEKGVKFVSYVEREIERNIDWIGLGPETLLPRDTVIRSMAA